MSVSATSPDAPQGSQVITNAPQVDSWMKTAFKVGALVTLGTTIYLFGHNMGIYHCNNGDCTNYVFMRDFFGPVTRAVNSITWWASWTPTLLLAYGASNILFNAISAGTNLLGLFKGK